MREKEVWTVLGRKKILLVDDENQVVSEVKDLGPLSEIEMKYVKSNCGMPFDDWLETLKNRADEKEPSGDNPVCEDCACSCGVAHSDKQEAKGKPSGDDE